MFISIVDGNWASKKGCIAVNKVENNIFANSLINATIQDGGKRERSDSDLIRAIIHYSRY